MTEPRRWRSLLLISVALIAVVLATATAQERPGVKPTGGFDPMLSLFGMRMAPPDPITATPEAGLAAARAELAVGLALSERLARDVAPGVPLASPAQGPVIEGFGQRQAGGLRSQGLTLQVASGAVIRAPTRGDILYAGPLQGWGEAVILQATPRAQVVLAGDFATRVQKGEAVQEGQPLGAAAPRGASVNLYLELRDLGRPIDPAPWLRPEKAAALGSGFGQKTG